ncbi:MAG: cytochrome-c oxidase, cbb3-type subunit III [Woeseiaceae bacterium]|nr:cytochrome-c oxidase, cbb3-type subunit III [Woeseiaceae bacterium]NIP19568.1 cytochrome-c oxidase, cbb3-type subunit III [Woeseiaceae bacterium]NIS88522.1 cytochrome-c oxidase, cbb3-type subunit III [Woeseiaceae bacterium]
MTAFWAWFVAIGTIVFVIWCVWLVSWSAKQGPQGKEDEDLVGHKWDGDLEEWNNPAPKWWLYLYFITIAWGIGYMIAYPGIGAFEGVLGWSQEGQYEEEMANAQARYAPIYEGFAAMGFEALAEDPEALALGGSLFASYCTTCHGSDARGAPGYPNLTDGDWQWGGTEQDIITSITNGRIGIMTPWAQVLGSDEAVDNMVRYVQSLSGIVEADEAAMSAQPQFTTLCAACHTPAGTGNPLLGAPNLTDDIWLYGSSDEAIRNAIVNGLQGEMPAHGEFLGENRTRILAAYVYSLSQ